MAKTKLRNFRNATTLVRPDGTSVHYDPGMQEVSTEKYDGLPDKVKDVHGVETDHPLKGKSDYTHWHVEANSDGLETKEEREEAEKADAVPQPATAATTPTAAKSDGGTAKAKDDGKAIPNA